LADNVLEAKDKLIRFSRSRDEGQGRCKVTYEKLWHSDLLNSMKYHDLLEYDTDMTDSRHEGQSQGTEVKVRPRSCKDLLPQ